MEALKNLAKIPLWYALPMTTLLLIRHGIAEDWRFGHPDAERALTEEGWEKTRAAMRGLVALGHVPDRGISSPAAYGEIIALNNNRATFNPGPPKDHV